MNLQFSDKYPITLPTLFYSHSVIQDVSVMEVQEASEPLGGVFSLVVNGDGYNGQTDPLPHDANTDEVRKNTTIK